MSLTRTTIDLGRARRNVESIRARTGVDVIAVVKADAYGLGAVAVADAVGDLVAGFYVFHPREAADARLGEMVGKPILSTVPTEDDDLEYYLAHRIRPAVWTAERATRLAKADPVLAVDTGMQRFGCRPEDVDAILKALPSIREAFTHASRPEQAARLNEALAGRGLRRHAAATALLDVPGCALDAVRPGFAMFEGAVTVHTRLIDARQSRGPIGYGGFASPTGHHGVILLGYSHGLRPGPVLINGRPQSILETGMQSAYVSLHPADQIGDEVTLLGDAVTPEAVGRAWGTSPHNALLCLASLGERTYV